MAFHYHVSLIGFNKLESEKIKKIFYITEKRPRSYQFKLLEDRVSIDIIIVNSDVDFLPALNAFQIINPDVAVVTFSKKKDTDAAGSQHIKGMLLATKVIKALDALSIPERGTSSKAQRTTSEGLLDQLLLDVRSANTSDNNFTVLVVDDSPVMQKSLAIELSHAPQSSVVDFADSGETALEMIKKTQYDFIFLDVMMPGIDGYETCTEIRKIEGMKKTPVIMLSAKTSPLDEVKGVMAGCTSYLTKPIRPIEFQKMLARVMIWLRDFR